MNTPALSISLISFVFLLAGCDSKPTPPNPAPATPPAAPMADFQKKFEAQQRKNAEQQRLRTEREKHSRSFVEVKFLEFDAKGRVVVTMKNVGKKDIDDIRGGIRADDSEGNYLAASGYTEAVPGSLFLAAGATTKHAPFISPKPDLNARLRADPGSVVFHFTAQAITYADGSKESGLLK